MAVSAAFLAVAALHAGSKKAHESHALSAKYAEGLDVQTKNGTDLGTLRDMVIDPRDGSIDFYVVDTGILGIGGEEKVLPAEHLKHPSKNKAFFTFTGTEKEFRNAHAMDGTRSFSENMEAAGASAYVADRLVPAMETVRHEVYAKGNENVGKVESWVIDPNRNAAPYLIVSDVRFGMSYSSGHEYFLVEADAIEKLEGNAGDIHLTVTEKEFSNAPKLNDMDAVETIRAGGVTIFRYELASM